MLEFSAPYGSATVSYVPVVHADPSDKIVPLRGTAFLQITVQGAVAAYEGVPITPYDGPTTVTPVYSTMKQVCISGEFEAVLSFGVGLGRTAGFRVTPLGNPSRIVVDVANPPDWRMWPETNLSSARAVRASFDQGHQPWRGDPVGVVRVYAQSVYRISDAVVTRVAAIDTYRVSHRNSVDSIIVHVVKPFGHGIYEIADNPLSGVLTTGAGTACLAGMRLRHIRVPTARRLPGPPRPAATSEPELRQTTTAEHG